MSSRNAFLDGTWVPDDSKITFQDFKHWEKAMRHSHEMSKNQAKGQLLRQLPMDIPSSPIFTHPIVADKQQSDNFHDTHPDAIVFRLARNRAALEALRRTHKMRYRRNLKYLAASFPLADEPAAKEKQAKEEAKKKAKEEAEKAQKEAEKAQGLTSAEILAQKELARKKQAGIAVEELKYIREMKAVKVKAAATERLKDKVEKTDATGKEAQKAAGKSAKANAGKGLEKTVRKTADKTARKTAEKTAGKSAGPVEPWSPMKTGEKAFNMFSAEKTPRKDVDKTSRKSVEKTAAKSAEKEAPEKAAPEKAVAPKSTSSKSGKMSLRAKMMPKMKRW